MHVDGGTTSQVFLFPSEIKWRLILEKLEIKSMPKVYVIRNSHFESEWEPVKPRLIPIAGRSISSLISCLLTPEIKCISLNCRPLIFSSLNISIERMI